jgi:ribose 5-phosphate isomerase RpiB
MYVYLTYSGESNNSKIICMAYLIGSSWLLQLLTLWYWLGRKYFRTGSSAETLGDLEEPVGQHHMIYNIANMVGPKSSRN